ncbi:MAG TPA: MarR family transcriptional regulator [Acidimicrobiales bacterium]
MTEPEPERATEAAGASPGADTDAESEPGRGLGARAGADADVGDLAGRLRLAIARIHRQLRQQAGTGLSPSQHSVLAAIDANGSLTLGELATIEQVAPPTITRIVAKLADDGLVDRTVDPDDRRVVRVSVTPEGHRRMDHSRQRRNALLARRLGDLDPDAVARLLAAVDVLEALAGPSAAPPPTPAPSAGPPNAAPPQTPPAAETTDPEGPADPGPRP